MRVPTVPRVIGRDGNGLKGQMDDITPGEISRSLKRLEDSQQRQTETLDEIKEQTTKTNGRVSGHDREIKDIKDTITWALRLIVGMNVSVVIGIVIWWVTHK